MAYTINGNIPCGTEACTGREHTPAGACNSVYDIILDAINVDWYDADVGVCRRACA